MHIWAFSTGSNSRILVSILSISSPETAYRELTQIGSLYNLESMQPLSIPRAQERTRNVSTRRPDAPYNRKFIKWNILINFSFLLLQRSELRIRFEIGKLPLFQIFFHYQRIELQNFLKEIMKSIFEACIVNIYKQCKLQATINKTMF